MQNKPLDSITLDDLHALVVDKIQEGKSIEYKMEAYRLDSTDTDYKRKQHEELLKDVSSFANTTGGHLLIGVEEDGGIPTNVCGIDCDDPDALKLRWNQIIENGLEPRVNVGIKAIPVAQGKCAFVFQISQSLVCPHRVVFRRDFGQFWARNSGGAYRMDTSELRQSFSFSATVFEQIRQFRIERIRSVSNGETPTLMPAGGRLICHLIPQESFSSRRNFDLASLQHRISSLRPFGRVSGWDHRYNMDGIVIHGVGDWHREFTEYTQIFRNGIVEIASADVVYTASGGNSSFLRTSNEELLVKALQQHLRFMGEAGISPPVWCFLTMTGVKDAYIRFQQGLDPKPPIDRDVLLLPEIEITDLSTPPLTILMPLFNMVWNSAGYPKCMSFDAEGNWNG